MGARENKRKYRMISVKKLIKKNTNVTIKKQVMIAIIKKEVFEF